MRFMLDWKQLSTEAILLDLELKVDLLLLSNSAHFRFQPILVHKFRNLVLGIRSLKALLNTLNPLLSTKADDDDTRCIHELPLKELSFLQVIVFMFIPGWVVLRDYKFAFGLVLVYLEVKSLYAFLLKVGEIIGHELFSCYFD